MKKYTLFLPLLLLMKSAMAQLPFSVMDSIDGNNINAAILVHGDMFRDPVHNSTGWTNPAYYTEKPEGAAALWMSAYDDAGQLHVSAQTYRQNGNDYWPGPLDASGALDYATSEQWAKIWKVRRSDVAVHLSNIMHHTGNTPEAILTWPAKGNAYAAGKDGVPLTITEDMAPFVDVNGDGTYQPLKGDYPDIKGEQTLFWVFSDNGPAHNQSNGESLGIEVHAMAYAFKRNTLVDDIIYIDYSFVNKSSANYHDMRVALWNDATISYPGIEYIGFDSSWRLGINYKDYNPDGGTAGTPTNSYKLVNAALGITMVRCPGDRNGNYIPAGSFMPVRNDPSVFGLPAGTQEYNNYMHSRFRNGMHLRYNADTPYMLISGEERNYVYPDDPSVVGGWNECRLGLNSGDRMYVLSSGDFTLNIGATERLVIAVVADTLFGSCPAITSFERMRTLADTAWNIYRQAVSVRDVSPPLQWLTVHPVPATQSVSIVMPVIPVSGSVLSVYNALGQRVLQQPAGRSATTLDIGTWPTGYYTVVVTGEEYIYRGRLIKQ